MTELNTDERLTKVENRIHGMEVGQQALREHIDSRLDMLGEQMASRDSELPISAPVWSFVMLAAGTMILALTQVIFMIDRYLL